MKHHRVVGNGITLRAVELGGGPAVLFCHGFPDTWRGWRRQMQAVAEAGFRALTLDMRGYGQSFSPADATLYTPFHTVGDLVGLLDALQVGIATVVGHDFGAQRRLERRNDAARPLHRGVRDKRSIPAARRQEPPATTPRSRQG